jgi:hypothetical protein
MHIVRNDSCESGARVITASAGVLGIPVPAGILVLLALRIAWYAKGRRERAQLYRSLPREDAKEVRAAFRSAGRNNLVRRVVWMAGFFGTLFVSTLAMSRLLGPGILTIVVTIVLWLMLWGLFARITGVGWIWTGKDLVRIVHRRR